MFKLFISFFKISPSTVPLGRWGYHYNKKIMLNSKYYD